MTNDSKSINRKFYTHIKQIGIDKFFIELIENFPCNNKEELNAREGFWIRPISTLNSQVAGRTTSQNKNKVHERRAQRVTCECGAEVCVGALNTHRRSPKHIMAMS